MITEFNPPEWLKGVMGRAIDGTRTRDFHLGKVALYQLSHYRTYVRLKPDPVKLILW